MFDKFNRVRWRAALIPARKWFPGEKSSVSFPLDINSHVRPTTSLFWDLQESWNALVWLHLLVVSCLLADTLEMIFIHQHRHTESPVGQCHHDCATRMIQFAVICGCLFILCLCSPSNNLQTWRSISFFLLLLLLTADFYAVPALYVDVLVWALTIIRGGETGFQSMLQG